MELRPKLRLDIVASEQPEEDGRRTIVLKDPVSEKYFKLSAEEFQLLKSLDGSITLEEAVERLKLKGHFFPMEEATMLINKAAQMGLLLGTRFSTGGIQQQLKDRFVKAKRASRFSSIYFLFIPLVNPDRFLEKTLWLFKLLCNKWTGGFVALLVPGAIYFLISGLPKIHGEYLFFFNLENLVYLWVTIALTKLVHEFAHAYTAKSYGLHVPRMGVAFLIFFPCLYCDTTNAWNLADRKQRVAISAAGIIAEAGIAIITIYIWHFTKPGMVNSLAFYLMAVSFISTLLFNGNPLMKFDGYFILTDYIRVTNLQQKSFSYMKYLFMNRVLGITLFPNPASIHKETLIFGVYGVSAFLYRCSLYTGIVMGVYYRFDRLLGIMLAVLAFVLFIVRPIVRALKNVYTHRAEVHPRASGVAVALLLAAAILLILTVPMSSHTVYPCYLASARTQKLTVPLQTSVSEMFIRAGDTAKEGTLLFQLNSTRLRLSLANKVLDRTILEKEKELLLLDPEQMAKASEKPIEMDQVDHEIRLLKRDLSIAQEAITAPFDGVVAKLDPLMRPGFQPGEGTVVGEFESQHVCVVKTLVPEKDAHKLFPGQKVEIWFPIGSGLFYPGVIDSIESFHERNLAEGPFSSRIGGEVATETKDQHHLDAPLEAQYLCYTRFVNDDLLPLRISGRCAVVSPRVSILGALVNRAVQAFNRESVW